MTSCICRPVVDWLDPEAAAASDAPESDGNDSLSGKVKLGDLVLTINGVETAGMTQDEVDALLDTAAAPLATADPDTPSLALAVVLEVVDCACAPGATTFILSHPTGLRLADSSTASASDGVGAGDDGKGGTGSGDANTAGPVVECIPGGNAEKAGVWPQMRLQRLEGKLCTTLPREAAAALLATPLDARRGVTAVKAVEVVLFDPVDAAAAAARAALGGSRTSNNPNSRANSNRNSLMTPVPEETADKGKRPTPQPYENVVLLPPPQKPAATHAVDSSGAGAAVQEEEAETELAAAAAAGVAAGAGGGDGQIYENVVLNPPFEADVAHSAAHPAASSSNGSTRRPVPAPRRNVSEGTSADDLSTAATATATAVAAPLQAAAALPAEPPTPTPPTAERDGSAAAAATVTAAHVLYTFSATNEDEMSLVAGKTITVLDTGAGTTADGAWWAGVTTDGGVMRSGWFPASHVLPIISTSAAVASQHSAEANDPYASSSDEEAEDNPGAGGAASSDDSDDDLPADPAVGESAMSEMYAAIAEVVTVQGGSGDAAGDVDDDDSSYAILSPDGDYVDEAEQKLVEREQKKEADIRRAAKRKQVAEEMIATEAAYVTDLEAMVEGYVKKMRPLEGQLFDSGSIDVLFSNVEQLWSHQQKFVARLEVLVGEQGPRGAAECFLEFADSFEIYSVYCSNHTRGSQALEQLLSQSEQAWSFFEGCRLLLDGAMSVAALMIKPVQRICQYPLLLGELVKVTGAGHPDYQSAVDAGARMKTIALGINEDKRLREEVLAVQTKIEGWDGPPLSVWSSRLYKEGVVQKYSGSKLHERNLFLLDNLLVFTKTLSSKGKYQVTASGKLFTHNCEFEAVPDGHFKHGKKPIVHAFKVKNPDKGKWYVLSVGSEGEKVAWLAALAEERTNAAAAAAAGVVSLVHLAQAESGASKVSSKWVSSVQSRVQVRSRQARMASSRKGMVVRQKQRNSGAGGDGSGGGGGGGGGSGGDGGGGNGGGALHVLKL